MSTDITYACYNSLNRDHGWHPAKSIVPNLHGSFAVWPPHGTTIRDRSIFDVHGGADEPVTIDGVRLRNDIIFLGINPSDRVSKPEDVNPWWMFHHTGQDGKLRDALASPELSGYRGGWITDVVKDTVHSNPGHETVRNELVGPAYADNLTCLGRELAHLGARNPVLILLGKSSKALLPRGPRAYGPLPDVPLEPILVKHIGEYRLGRAIHYSWQGHPDEFTAGSVST